MKKYIFLVLICALNSCKKTEGETAQNNTPTVSNEGKIIVIPDKKSADFFKTETAKSSLISADITATAQVTATVINNKVILFSNPELTTNYTELLNHQSAIRQKEALVNQKEAVIKQKKIEIERFEDLAKHGAATGKEVADAKTDKIIAESEKSAAEAELIAERSLIIEHTSKLKSAGFNTETLMNSNSGSAWLIADVSENQMAKIKAGTKCNIKFTAFPNETFSGTVNGVADVMDNVTRMTKVRIALDNRENKFRSGMFALVSFGVSEGDFISVDKNALITIQGKNYVFIRTKDNVFERLEVQIGQQIGSRIIIFSGLRNNDKVVVTGAMQLKGLSFGY